MAAHSNDSFNNARVAVRRVTGVFLSISAIGVGVIGFFALEGIAGALQKSPEHAANIAPAALDVIAHRWLLIVLVMPALAAGLALVLSARPGAWRWLLFVAGMLWIVAVFVGVLYAFIMFMAPLYQYQPL